MRIRVFWEGKTKDAHLRALVADYTQRIAKFTEIVIEELPEARKSGSQSAKTASPCEARMWEKPARGPRFFLDRRAPSGLQRNLPCGWATGEFTGRAR